MLFEFQVIYRVGPDAPLQSLLVRAEEGETAADLVKQSGGVVLQVGTGRPLVDWDQPTWTRDEAAVFFRAKNPSFVDELMARGELPRSKNGRPIFTRRMLEKVIEARMGKEAA